MKKLLLILILLVPFVVKAEEMIIEAPSAILMELEKAGLFFYGTNNVESARETINGQWWERNDFTFTVNECIKVENPNIPQLAKDIDVEVLVLNE